MAMHGETTPKTRLVTLDDLDKRTRAGQRAHELHNRLLSERGGADRMGALRQSFTKSVAALTAKIEDMEARWLLGDESVEPADIATLLNARRREAEIIGIDPEPRDVTPTLAQYLAAKRTSDVPKPAGEPSQTTGAASAAGATLDRPCGNNTDQANARGSAGPSEGER